MIGLRTSFSLSQRQRLAFRDWARYTHNDLLEGLVKHNLNQTGLLKNSAVTWAEIQLNESRVTHLLCAFVEDAGANGRRSIKKGDSSRPSVDAFACRKITKAL